MAWRTVRRPGKRIARTFAALVLVAATLYFWIPRKDFVEVVWRQSRGTRYEGRIARWALADSPDPIDRALARDVITPGGSVETLIATYGQFDVTVVGRYHVLKELRPPGTLSFGGWTMIACDGRLVSASSYSCTYYITHFNTLTPTEDAECTQLYLAEMDRRRAARDDARLAVAGFGAIPDLRSTRPTTPPDAER